MPSRTTAPGWDPGEPGVRIPFLERWLGRRPRVQVGLDPSWLRQARVQLPERPPERPEDPPPAAPAEESGGDGRHQRRWRALALGLAVLEVGLLMLLVLSPAFRVRDVVVAGTQRTTPQDVILAAGLGHSGSVFMVDGAGVRRRLASDIWVRSSTVNTSLPGRVDITVQEWQPVAVYRGKGGVDVVVNERGQTLGAAGPDAATLPRIEGPAPAHRAGDVALDPQLLVALVNIQRSLPSLMGQQVLQFNLDGCWNLTLVGVGGWRVLFGRMQAPSDYDTLRPKLAALQAVAPHADFNDPQTYVNVMNPQQPAVGKGQDRPTPPTPTPAPPASGARDATPARTATPPATPAVTGC